jgi:salicylate hydroxylase/6-hydroxynicotinate 3-monooxygenase
MKQQKPSSAVVSVGMGGGLAVAATLYRVGIDVQVYEQTARFGRIGAGIQMMPNSMRSCASGSSSDCARHRLHIRTHRDLQRRGLRAEIADARRVSTMRHISACIGPTYMMRLPRQFPRDIVHLEKSSAGLDQARAAEVTALRRWDAGDPGCGGRRGWRTFGHFATS